MVAVVVIVWLERSLLMTMNSEVDRGSAVPGRWQRSLEYTVDERGQLQQSSLP